MKISNLFVLYKQNIQIMQFVAHLLHTGNGVSLFWKFFSYSSLRISSIDRVIIYWYASAISCGL